MKVNLGMKIKIIKNYDRKDFSETELLLIDIINENPEEFLSSFNLKKFCEKNSFSVSILQKIAKKLKYCSANEMKSKLTKVYFDSIDSNKKQIDQNFQNININKYVNKLEIALKTIDENLINNLIKKILNVKYLYIYNSDQLFDSKTFNFFSSILDFKIYRIDNNYRFEILKKIGINKNSVLIITKVFKELTDFESNIINFFKNKEIEIFTISAVTGLFPSYKNINNVVIGNYKNNNNDDIKIVEFKIYYSNLINIITYNLFLHIQNK